MKTTVSTTAKSKHVPALIEVEKKGSTKSQIDKFFASKSPSSAQLKKLNLEADQIQRLIVIANDVLDDRKNEDRENAQLEILRLVNSHKIPFDALTELLITSDAIYTDKGRSKKVYIDRKNPHNKPWNCVGRPPVWITEALEKGIDIEKEYAVETAEDKDHISAWFFNPKRPSSRWNGIGNKPRWYKDLEAQGEDMNKYRAFF